MRGEDTNSEEAGARSPASFDSSPEPPLPETDPILNITIWPHRSLPRHGFRWVLWFTAGMLTIPLIPLLGTPLGWVLLPFLVSTLLLLWFFIERNYWHGYRTREIIRIWPNLIRIDRFDPPNRHRHWHGIPYWVRTKIYPDAKIENYLTVTSEGREIEIGAFLAPEERIALQRDIDRVLGDLRHQQHGE